MAFSPLRSKKATGALPRYVRVFQDAKRPTYVKTAGQHEITRQIYELRKKNTHHYSLAIMTTGGGVQKIFTSAAYLAEAFLLWLSAGRPYRSSMRSRVNYKNISNILILEKLSISIKSGVLTLAIFASTPADADGWAIFSEHAQMKGYVIAEVGEVSKVDPPFNTKWENDVYQINGRCFSFLGYSGYWGYGSKAALLLVNAEKIIKLALIESSIGSIKTELKSVIMFECPSGTNVIPYSEDPQEQLRLLQKRQDELKKKLEDLQKEQR